MSDEMAGGDALPRVTPWLLSARSRDALRAQAERLHEHLTGDTTLDPLDIGFSLTQRPLLEERAVVLGAGREELQEGVGALARGERSERVIEGTVPADPGGLSVMFTGQGAQRVGMGSELYERLPVFRAAFDEACVHLDAHLGQPLRSPRASAPTPSCNSSRPAPSTTARSSSSGR
jgi:acyl transferase domain-containing protein